MKTPDRKLDTEKNSKIQIKKSNMPFLDSVVRKESENNNKNMIHEKKIFINFSVKEEIRET
jgi:hypothetical protein